MDTDMNFIVFITTALALTSVVATDSGFTSCNSLKPAPLDLQWLFRSNPLTVFRSSTPLYECGQVIFVAPSGDNDDYSGTGIIIIGNYTFTYDDNLSKKSLVKAVSCSNGQIKEYQIVYVNSKSPSASVCVVSCNDNDATKYDVVVCFGRTSSDERDIETFLKTTLKGVEGIKNAQSNCPKPRYCDTFTN